MNKKLLLRRPKCIIKTLELDHASLPKISESELRTSFKEEIQSEIQLLDEEHEKILTEVDKNVSKIEEKNEKISSNNQCTVVSAWSIDEFQLPPTRTRVVGKIFDGYTLAKNNCASGVDEIVAPSHFQSEVYRHDLFQQIESSLPQQNRPVPKHIIIIQMVALLKRQLSNDMNGDCTIKKLPKKFTSNFEICPKFEIVLLDNHQFKDKNAIKPYELSEVLQRKLMKSEHEGAYRHIEDDAENEVSATDVSMMECHLTGRQHLRLSAHSISEVPNLNNIFPNLTVIDLSYNSFKIIPVEVLELYFLEELNLRNNPIEFISENIYTMNNLRVLICSFTRLSAIPPSVFMCPNLEELDLSYNNIHCIPNIPGPQKLKTLNLSGNPLRYFKKSFGRLSLHRLALENTRVHPVFWCSGQFDPPVVDKSWQECDLCDQPLSDFTNSTLSFCRKYDHILPILLSFCSTICATSFHS